MTPTEIVTGARAQLGDPSGTRFPLLMGYVGMAVQRVATARPDLLVREDGTAAPVPAAVTADTELPFDGEVRESLVFLTAGLALMEDSDDGRNRERGQAYVAQGMAALVGR